MDKNKLDKILEYLETAVNYEKERNRAIKNTGTPFSFEKIISATDNLNDESLNSIKDCLNRTISNKVLKNILLRRAYEVYVREGIHFDEIDFSNLATNSRFQKLKSKILKNDKDLLGVGDEDFLRQVANAIAHGNYVELLDIDGIENSFQNKDAELNLNFKDNGNLTMQYEFSNDDSGYDQKSKDLYEKLRAKKNEVRVTPRELFIVMLDKAINKNCENLKFRYESNYEIDENGNRVKRPATVYYELELTFEDIDEILLFIISSMQQNRFLALVGKEDQGTLFEAIDEGYRSDAEKILDKNNIVLYNSEANVVEDTLTLDDHQKEYFIDEYVRCRELFDKAYYKKIFNADFVADIISTNATTQLKGLSDMLTSSRVRKLAYINFALDRNVRSYFSFVNNLFPMDAPTTIQDFIADETQIAYANKQIYEVYNESLISEILLLLQILEDKGKLSEVYQNNKIMSIVNSLDLDVLNNLRANSKFTDDTKTFIYHLRNSFTHMTYLLNPNGDICIYDQISKRNRNLIYKYNIDIPSLEIIKNELLSKVKMIEHLNDNENSIL